MSADVLLDFYTMGITKNWAEIRLTWLFKKTADFYQFYEALKAEIYSASVQN